MKSRTMGILMVIAILLSAVSFVVPMLISGPAKTTEQVSASQGIRVVGSTLYYDPGDSTVQRTLKVHDVLIGTNEQVFRINEIRKSHDKRIYLVVSWKYIFDYDTYEEYRTTPYRHIKTYDLESFMVNKQIINESDVQSFYEKMQQTKPAKIAPNAPVSRVLSGKPAQVMDSVASGDLSQIGDAAEIGESFQVAVTKFQELCAP